MAKRQEMTYFDELCTLMGFSCQAAEFLRQVLSDYHPEALEQQIQRMHEIEHRADQEKHRIMGKLSREFITPIDREDIVALVESIDNVTDAIEEVLRKMYMYNVRSADPFCEKFADIILEECRELMNTLRAFKEYRKKAKTLATGIVRINELEEQGDQLHLTSIRGLFTRPLSATEVMARTEIAHAMEDCCDAGEEVSENIEAVILKNS